MTTVPPVRAPWHQLQAIYAWLLLGTVAVAVVAAFVSLQTAIMLGILVIAAWWAWLNPLAGFFFLVVIAPLLPLFKVTQTVGNITLIKDVLIVSLLVKLVLWPALTQKLPYRRNVLLLPLLLWWLWIGQATLRADTVLLGALRARDLVLYSFVYLIVLYLPRPKNFWREFVAWIALSFLATALLAAWQFYGAPDSAVLRFDPVARVWIPRISSTFGHPSVFGQYLIMIAASALALLLLIDWRKAIQKTVAALVVLLCLILIYFTYSRAVWLGLAGALTVAVMVKAAARLLDKRSFAVSQARLLTGFIALTIMAIALWQFTAVGVFLSSAFDTTYRSNEIRLEYLARLVAPTSNAEAMVGRGLGDVTLQNFREVALTSFDIASGASRTIQVAKDRTLVDNQYLKTFIELGLVGLLLYAWIFIRLFKTSWQLIRHGSDARRGPAATIGLASVGFMTALVIQALFIDIWDIFPTNLAFWLVAGLVSREARD